MPVRAVAGTVRVLALTVDGGLPSVDGFDCTRVRRGLDTGWMPPGYRWKL